MAVVFIFLFSVFEILVADPTFEKDSLFNDRICGTSLEDFGSPRSTIMCAGMCMSHATCTSFFYNGDTLECYGVNTALNSASGCVSQQGIVYFKKTGITTTTSTTTTTTPSTYGATCLSSATCTGANTDCVSQLCQCRAGYSLVQATSSCVESCSVYGSTYTEYPQSAMLTAYTEYSGVTVEECKGHCTNSNTCRGFNFSGSLCRLKNDTPLTHPGSFISLSTVSYFKRNCA